MDQETREALLFLLGVAVGGLIVVSIAAIEAFLEWRRNR